MKFCLQIVEGESTVVPFQSNTNFDRHRHSRFVEIVDVNDGYIDQDDGDFLRVQDCRIFFVIDVVADLDDVAVALVGLVRAVLDLVATYVLMEAVPVVAAKVSVGTLKKSN